jgi:hypothetical protein
VIDDNLGISGPAVCQRCADQPLSLATCLPRMGDHPAYRIFTCSVCGFIEWIAEHVKEPATADLKRHSRVRDKGND